MIKQGKEAHKLTEDVSQGAQVIQILVCGMHSHRMGMGSISGTHHFLQKQKTVKSSTSSVQRFFSSL